MSKKIYKKTFIRESEEVIKRIDDSLSIVEEGVDELDALLQKLTSGNLKDLHEKSETHVGSYEDKIEQMQIMLSNMYSYKNDLLDNLELLSVEEI